MKLSKLIAVPENSDVARVYTWEDNHLTLEELLAFLHVRGKFTKGDWLEK
jgi:hypothetical protein